MTQAPGPLPTEEQIDGWHQSLVNNSALMSQVNIEKGWTTSAIKQHEIGFDGEWITIPYKDWEHTTNVMKYKPFRDPVDTGPKMLPYSRGHQRSLYPMPGMWGPESRIPNQTVFLVEGESDAITARSAGLNAVAVPGANGWRKQWVHDFWNLRPVLMFDDDGPGQTLTARLVNDFTDRGIEVRVLDLATVNDSGESGFDFGDYVAAEIRKKSGDDPDTIIKKAGAFVEAWAKDTPAIKEVVVLDDTCKVQRPARPASELLSEVRSTISRYVVTPSEASLTAISLWVLHTWAIGAAHVTPYLLVISAEKRSGKTRLIEVLHAMVRNPWATVDASPAAMFRKIEQDLPTLFLDEIDAIFGTSSERTEPLRAIINAGNRASGSVSRCVGEDMQVKDFCVFGPKLLAGIDKGSKLSDTIRDRAITIAMFRRTSSEPVERLIPHKVTKLLDPLRLDLEAWSDSAVPTLTDAEPTLPDALDDRAAEAWEPLLAIADHAGGEWPENARAAALELSGGVEEDSITNGALILGAIKELLGDHITIGTTEILDEVNGRDDLPFGGWRDGEGLNPRILARTLKPYKVKPRKVRLQDGGVRQGYHRDDLLEAFVRWLPDPLPEKVEHPEHPEHPTEPEQETPLEQANVPHVPHVPDIPDMGEIEGNWTRNIGEERAA